MEKDAKKAAARAATSRASSSSEVSSDDDSDSPGRKRSTAQAGGTKSVGDFRKRKDIKLDFKKAKASTGISRKVSDTQI